MHDPSILVLFFNFSRLPISNHQLGNNQVSGKDAARSTDFLV
jgi:hypothetical protein